VQEANVAVPLLRPDQNSPRSGGPVGRLRRLLNGIVQKHDDNGRIKVEKRNGFHALSRNVSSVVDASSLGTPGTPGTTLIATLGEELVQIADSVPYVYSPTAPGYKKFADNLVMTETAHRHVVRASTQTISMMSRAAIGDIVCTVWSEGGKCYAQFDDVVTDTPVRAPLEIATGGRIKVVADGVRFWLVSDANSTTATVKAFGTNGAVQDSKTLTTLPATLPSAPAPWDIQAMPGTGAGMVIAHNAAVGVDYTRLVFATFSAGAIVVSAPVFDDRAPMTYGVAFLMNEFDATHLYIATTTQFSYAPPIDPVRGRGLYVFKLTLAGAHVSTYIITTFSTQADAAAVANLTGYVDNVGGAFVSYTTYLQSGGIATRQSRATVTTRRGDPEPTASVLYGVQRSVALCGQIMKIGSRYVLPCYYPSVSQEGQLTSLAVPVAQATYFLIDVSRQLIVGELEYGRASFDWPYIGWDPTKVYGDRFFVLPASFVDTTGIVHWTAGYAADIETAQVNPGTAVNIAIPEVGILDVQIGGRGVAVEVGDELLIPGLRAVSFARDRFTAHGIELAPEVPSVTPVNNGSGSFVSGETHRYAVVWSELDTRGNRIRSITGGTTTPVQSTGSNNANSLAIPTLRQTTHTKLLAEIYRDVWDTTTGQAGSQLRKITVDEQMTGDPRVPQYNDPTVDFVTFVDTVTNAAAAIGAPIYTDDGTLDYFPCPAFSTGCVFGDRVFVGGYDNRIYYSFSKIPGQALAFNQDEFYFTVPTNQRVTALAAMDDKLVIFCERSIWYVEDRNFLSADATAGSNPTPIELKFKNGCRGRAEPITAGILYDSSAGGLWLLTRSLDNVPIGAAVDDETAGKTILDIATDEDQRICVLLSGGSGMVVYDQVSNVWSAWQPGVTGDAMTVWMGKLTFAGNDGTTYQQTNGAWDDNGVPIQTRVELADISLADIHGFQVIWEVAALGEWKGAHTFTVDITYDGSTTIDETFSETFAVALVPFRFDWQPRTTECSAIGLTISDTFPGAVPSQGFTLESLDLYVGIERGKKYNENRIAPAG
jgi:hypothetical protein